MPPIELKWTDYRNLSNAGYETLTENERQKQHGVYIWGFTIDEKFIPYYVGITDKLLFRMYEHVNGIIGGRYTIFHKNSLANFTKYKEPIENEHKLYISDWHKGYKRFIDRRKELQEHIDFMVDNFTFTFACVNDESRDRPILKNVEKLCIEQIGKNNLGIIRGGRYKDIEVIHGGNEDVISLFSKS